MIARENAAKHGVEERILFLVGDMFGPIIADEQIHVLVRNPPCIADEVMTLLPVGVREVSPHMERQGGPGGFVGRPEAGGG